MYNIFLVEYYPKYVLSNKIIISSLYHVILNLINEKLSILWLSPRL